VYRYWEKGITQPGVLLIISRRFECDGLRLVLRLCKNWKTNRKGARGGVMRIVRVVLERMSLIFG
jgi:hypothetical protein